MTREIWNKPLSVLTPPPPGKMTYEQFLDWMHEDTHAEWVNAEVVFITPVSIDHNNLSGFLLVLIRHFVEAYQSGMVLFEPSQMKTGPDLPSRSPDIIFVAKEHLSRLKKTHLEGPADLVVEIISPESRARDRGEKFCEYEQGGVREYWLIDPIRKQAEFYHLGKDGIYRVMPISDNGLFRSAVLEGLWLKVEWLWQEPLPPLLSVLKEWRLI